jgi:hypothetical protein
MDLRTQAIAPAGECSYDGEKQWRPPGPYGRVSVPEEIASIAVSQSGQLCTQRIDLGGKVAGTQQDPRALLF